MPTATDLVTDLPADFEVFGQAVATSMADLLGGTTGQVLAKASNADMDFVWSADAAGMTNPMTTTGDTIYSSSGSTPTRLGIGTTGQVLTVAGGVPTWSAISAGAYTLLSTTNLSGTITTVSSISQSYTDLIILIENASISSGSQDTINLRLNGISTSNYRTVQNKNDGTTLSQSGLVTGFTLGIEAPLGASEKWSRVVIPFYTLSTEKPMIQFMSQNDGADMYFGWGGLNSAGAVNSISIRDASGNPFDAGTVKIYGVK